MKKSLATTLSLVGVLGAGSAAALVNTQVLNSGPAEATASAALLPTADQVDLTIPAIGTLPETTATIALPELATGAAQPGVTVGAPARDAFTEGALATSTTAAAQPSGWLTAFNVGESGVVTVDVVSGKLIIVKAEPMAGWSITNSEERDDNSIEVTFASATVRVEFTAVFADGQITPAVESASIPTPTSSTTAAAPVAPPAYHDDDDEYEHDDHDNDHNDEYEHSDDHGGERDDD
jgi:hypothetical protein